MNFRGFNFCRALLISPLISVFGVVSNLNLCTFERSMKNYDEMNSKKSERRSRRSSILKAPKPRQPLQNVELSPSHSTENSPCPSATKIRRRVSFAEKKHVKEFCDSAEQGTVWDNTYEESDSSHIRNSQNSNNDENIAPNGRLNDLSKEQVDTPLQLINGSRTCDSHSMQDQCVNSAALKTVVSSINYEATNTLNTKDIEYHETNGMEFGLDRIDAVGIEHPELAPMLENKKITIFCDNSIDARLEENAAFPQNPQSTQSETNTELSICTGESMIPQKDPSEKTLVFSNKSMDFTEVVKTTSNITMPQQTSPESTTIFHNVSVDFTEIVENIKEVEEPLDKTTIGFNNTVDFTEIVENIPTIQELTPEKTIVFHDASINFTEVIDNIGKSEEETEKSTLEKTMIFNDVFVDITEAVSNIPTNGKASSDIFERTFSSEDTLKNCIDSSGTNLQRANYSMMLHHQSMEITKAIPSVLSAGERIVEESSSHPYTGENCLTNSSSNYKSMAEGKTMVFHNVSMELTGAVQFPLQTTDDNRLNNGKQQCESKNLADIEKDCRTMIFHDDSMEFTQVQSSSKPKPIPVRDKENCLTAMEDCPRKELPRAARQLQKENILETLENDDNPLNNGKQQCESKNPADIEKDCRTMIFHDDSMEFTQVQSSSKPKPIPVRDKENCLTAMEDCPRKDLPRAARQLQKENILETLENDDNPLNNGKQQCESRNLADIEKDCRTMIFHDDSMEFTQVQSSSKPKPIPVRDKENCLTAMEDCPRKELPRAARQLQKENILETLENDDNPLNNGKQQCESKNLADIEKDCRTMIFHDDSMEFTQVQSSSKPKTIPVRDKENFLTAMEDCPRKDFPRAARQLQKENILETLENDDNPLNNGKQQCESRNLADIEKDCRTMIFHDDSMEFTQVQSSSKPKPIPVPDKENFLTAMEDCPRKDFPRAARQLQKENILETLENKFMKMITSVKFPSLRENEESLENRSVTTDGRRTHDCIAQDISGVSPLNSQTINFEPNPQDVQNLEKSREVVTFQNDDMELSQIQQRSEETENNSINQETDNNSLKLSTRLLPNITLSLEQIQQNVSKGTNVEMINVLQTPKVPNATEFDEETFLLQRALCLKNHEADSIASQESSSRPLTFVEDEPILMDVGRQKSPIATTEFLSGTKLVESNDETFAARFSTTVDQADRDRSLEELRAKASSVIRYCPEDMAYELTERINRIFPSDFRESSMSEDLQTEEPPSFGFAYSITEDSVSSANASSNKLDPFLDKENIKSVDIMEEASSFPVSQFVERKSASSPIVAMELPEITTTMVQQVGNYNDGRNNASPVERMVRKEIHRSQTRSDVFVPEVNLSSVDCHPTITDCVKNHSSCKIRLTTASEFSSESTNGPSVKLRRGDDDSTKEESSESEKRSLVIAEPWSNRYFANSTAIGNDFEQGSPHQNIDDNFNPVKNSFIDELSSIIVSNKGRNVNDSVLDEARTKERIDHITKNLEMSDYKSSFFALKQTIENLSKRLDVIWDINRLDEKIVAFNFFSKSIVLVVYLEEDSDSSRVNGIKDVVLLSQLVKERTDPGLCLAHDLIMKTMDNAFLKRSCQSYEEIPQLLEHVSSRVKLGMDFAFELDRLRNHNVMEIDENRITFIARARDINAGIILNVTMVIKPFEEIDHNDITVSYLLGGEKIRKNYIERLITNVKRDHRFLRFYMADVKDYIDLMAEMGSTNR